MLSFQSWRQVIQGSLFYYAILTNIRSDEQEMNQEWTTYRITLAKVTDKYWCIALAVGPYTLGRCTDGCRGRSAAPSATTTFFFRYLHLRVGTLWSLGAPSFLRQQRFYFSSCTVHLVHVGDGLCVVFATRLHKLSSTGSRTARTVEQTWYQPAIQCREKL